MFQRLFFTKSANTPEDNWTLVFEADRSKLYKTQTDDLDQEMFLNWSKNRPVDPVRIAQIQEFFSCNNIRIIPGVISIWQHHNKFHVYDGIHRLQAAFNSSMNMTLLIHVLMSTKEQEVIDDFVNLNKSINVPVIYLEETNWMKRNVCQSVADEMCRRYSAFVSPSRNPYRYNFNRDNLVDFLSTLEIDYTMSGVDKILLNEFVGLNLRAMDYVNSNKIKHPNKCDYHKFWLFYLDQHLIKHCLEKACRQFS